MRKARGFTLIELLIVVAIIAILAAIAVPNFLEAQVRAKVSRTKSDMRSIALALESYRLDYTEYPNQFDPWPWLTGRDYFSGFAATYRKLTTPVAYMTTSPHDHFILPQDFDGRNELHVYHYADRKSWETAHYTPGDATFDEQFTWPADRDRTSGVQWSIKSYGPDRVEGVVQMWDNIIPVESLPYDASNGTVSIGDILRWGP